MLALTSVFLLGCAGPKVIREPYPVEVVRTEYLLPDQDLLRCPPKPEWPAGHLTWLEIAGQAKRFELWGEACEAQMRQIQEWADEGQRRLERPEVSD